MDVYVYVNICTCLRMPRPEADVLTPLPLPTLPLETGFLTPPREICPGWMNSKQHGSSCLHLLSAGIISACNQAFKKKGGEREGGAREMAQGLRALAALTKDPSSTPNTHVTAHSCL